MKEKLSKDLFDTQCWCYRVVADPYQVIAEGFSIDDMEHLRNFIKEMMHYSEAEEIYAEESPGEVLLSMRIIRSLIKAAHNLKEKKNGPIEVSETDVFNKDYYCSHYQSSTEWEQFPRFVSMKEFCNPYKVFRKFFKYQPLDKWIHDWEEMVDCALSQNSGEQELEMIAVYRLLSKLVEAAHLINVREVTHIGGMLKNRFIER